MRGQEAKASTKRAIIHRQERLGPRRGRWQLRTFTDGPPAFPSDSVILSDQIEGFRELGSELMWTLATATVADKQPQSFQETKSLPLEVSAT